MDEAAIHPRWGAGVGSLLLALTLVALAANSASGERPSAPRRAGEILVEFRAEGENALEECAETVSRSGGTFRHASADDSDSLDRLHAELGVRRVRALFRRPDGRPFAEQRRSLRERLERAQVRNARPSARGRSSAIRQRARATDSPLPDLSHWYAVRLGPGVEAARALERFAADPHVARVQVNHLHVLDYLPDDPFLHSSGSWGQDFEDLWGLHRIGAEHAWDYSRGEGVVVAVVDTGLDYEHPDIAANVWVNPGEDLDGNGRVDASDWNGLDDDGNGFVDDLRGFDFANSLDADGDDRYDGADDLGDPDPFDDHGHGTHVAGTIAAVADNGIGIVGVAPNARIMPLKGFAASGAGEDAVLWPAVLYAAENGARVINNSWSCATRCPVNPLAESVVAAAHAMGSFVVTSAGNARDDVSFRSPENTRDVITVASIGQDDVISHFSNFGQLIDVAAPGGGPVGPSGVTSGRQNVLSLNSAASTYDESSGQLVDTHYLRLAGTSMAAPHVAGVAALLIAQRPEIGYEELRRVLRETARDLGPEDHSPTIGAGVLDAAAALAIGDDLADVALAITAPRQASVQNPLDGDIEIRGRAHGPDFLDYSLWVGAGRNPAHWEAIVEQETSPVADDLLATWRVSQIPDGSYLIRLELRDRAGGRHLEFLVLDLERNTPEPLSPPTLWASRPAISGARVLWQGRPERDIAKGEDLYLTELHTGRVHTVAAEVGEETDGAIAGRLIAWMQSDLEDEQPVRRIMACRWDTKRAACSPKAISAETRWLGEPVVARGRVAWPQYRESSWDLLYCGLNSRTGDCPLQVLAGTDANEEHLDADGLRFVWRSRSGPKMQLETCLVDPRSESCPVLPVLPSRSTPAYPSLSGDLLGAQQYASGFSNELTLCTLDADTGACPPVSVVGPVLDSTPAVSGNRLVWHMETTQGDSDIYLCEFDASTGSCPVQRITASSARQRHPVIEGNRVVWEDDRSGLQRIFGIELPSISPLRDRHVRAGSLLWVLVRGHDPGRGPIALDAEARGAQSLAELGASFSDLGDGRGLLRWRPGFEQAGSYVFAFRGTGRGGLHTTRSIQVEVRARRGWNLPRWLRHRFGWYSRQWAGASKGKHRHRH